MFTGSVAPPGADSPQLDGRTRRAATSRGRIVKAMLALVGEGVISPTAEQIAARAGVGLRTVFHHFRDMDALYIELTAEVARRFEAMAAPFKSPDWQGQLAELIDRRLTAYEKLLPLKRAGDVHRHRSKVLQASHAASQAALRARLQSLLPAARAADAAAFEALDLTLSLDSWQRLRDHQRLSPDAARATITHLVALILAAPKEPDA